MQIWLQEVKIKETLFFLFDPIYTNLSMLRTWLIVVSAAIDPTCDPTRRDDPALADRVAALEQSLQDFQLQMEARFDGLTELIQAQFAAHFPPPP